MKKIILRTNQNDPQIKAYKEAVERGRKSQHVVPNNGGWVIIGEGGKKPTTFDTQQEAIKHAKSIARSAGTSVYIHGADGRIRESESYENDPYPPQDVVH